MVDKVSIIIPAFNSSKYLDDALKSVTIQSLDHYEIIVVDDGSDKIEHDAYIKICSNYENLKLITKPNGGAASARNLGVEHASGQLLAFLDSDDVWLEKKIKSQINYMQEMSADLVLGNIQVTDELLNVRYKSAKNVPQKRDDLIQDLFYGKVIMNTPTILVKTEIFKKVGGFDENLKYREDHSFLIDVAQVGKIVLDPGFHTLRRERNGSLSSVSGIEQELNKHMPFWIKNESKFTFLKMDTARFKLVTRLFVFYVRNDRKKEIDDTLMYIKKTYPTKYIYFFSIQKCSLLLSCVYLLRNKIRNALL